MSSTTPRPLPEPALALGGVALVVGLGILVSADLTDAFDQAVVDLVRAPELRQVLSPLRQITELGSTWAVSAMALVVLVVGWALGRARHGLAGALTIAVASIINTTFKILVARERPDLLDAVVVEHGFSFPSGHSATGMVAYGVLAVIAARSTLPPVRRRLVVAACIAVIALVGLSRVWLGVHYPTDVIAGWAAGGVIVLAYAGITRRAWPGAVAEAADVGRAEPRSDRPVPG